MIKKEIIKKKTEVFAKKYYQQSQEYPKLLEIHIQLVRKFALKLAEIERADRFVVEIAALLHDIGKYKGRSDHNVRSYNLSKHFLKNFDIPEKETNLILKCIYKHSSRFSKEERGVEVKIIQSADALGTLFDDRWQEHCRRTIPKEELLKLYKKT